MVHFTRVSLYKCEIKREIIEWFPFECRETKTKTKAITMAKRKKQKQHNELLKTQSKYTLPAVTGAKRGKTRATY